MCPGNSHEVKSNIHEHAGRAAQLCGALRGPAPSGIDIQSGRQAFIQLLSSRWPP